MDVEGYECKVLHQYFSNPHPSYYLPYISMEWRNIRDNLGNTCPNIKEVVEDLYNNHYTPYNVNGNSVEDQGVPEILEMITRDELLVSRTSDILWAHRDAPALFW